LEFALSDTHADEARRLCEDGYALLEAGNIGDAEAAFVRARALDPHNPLVHFRLALAFVDSGRASGAVAALDASLRLQPDNARAHNNRGSALQLVGRQGDAEHALRRALALDPNLAQPYANLGHLLERGAPPATPQTAANRCRAQSGALRH
jgi:protein O-GlcNAc transferase